MMNDGNDRMFQKGGGDSVFCAEVPLAMAYVRDQRWEKPMRAMDALKNGTAFHSLVKPFLGAEVCDEKQ